MELGVIVELITTIGFPIVCVLALGWFVWHIYKQSVVREEKLMGEITENRLINKQFAEIIAKYEITLGEIKEDVKDIKDTLHINN
jgi:F0F1-type ATP synthase membrane subunit b/b'